MKSLDEFKNQERQRDLAFCGKSLAEDRATTFGAQGAHDPTASAYFVLEELFPKLGLMADSHVLDVGCGRGRALAFFVQAGLPGRITGVELDPRLSAQAYAWSKEYPQVEVTSGSVLDMDLSPFTHFFLFNPFDGNVLDAFLDKLETETRRPVLVMHTSDNGDTFRYQIRADWQLLDQGEFQWFEGVQVYAAPQHWSLWRLT